MRHIVILALGLVAALMLVGQLLSPVHPLDGPTGGVVLATPKPLAAATPTPSAYAGGEGLVIDRDPSGQFHVNAEINGQSTRFLVDTGADAVALTVADAEAAGIRVDPATFQPILQTASGEGWGTLVTMDRLVLGRTELHNVGAVVVKDLGVSLLGQSVLGQIGKLELKGDRMVLEPLH
ncbi:TIGR02281 family clan AA aspartic protease [Novosphingobium bradum]|uniref:TIGR02281 family clan AA aspartic protease n=1 Tax=Novosphingobium bradum TaxID=1737444 RepID=A0ABV7IJS9_9SPHN